VDGVDVSYASLTYRGSRGSRGRGRALGCGSGVIATNTWPAEHMLFEVGMGFHHFIERGVEYEVVPLPTSEVTDAPLSARPKAGD
jgi:hypothetical protein